MLNVIIAGGSGFLGKVLASHFTDKQYNVTIISRSKPGFHHYSRWMEWDGKTLGSWVECLNNADILINLSGKSVNCRYTEKNKQLLISSRVDSTNILGEALHIVSSPPKVWINASSATLFANNGQRSGEHAPHGIGFSVGICEQWEEALMQHETPQTRKIPLRMGLVLDEEGELMKYFRNIVYTGFGGKMGSGNQHISWLHYKDLVRIVDFIIDSNIEEPINAVSPTPTPNKVFMSAFRSAMKFWFGIPNAEWMIRFGTKVVGTEAELVLYDRQVIPEKLLASGFSFQFDTIDKALQDLL